MKNKELRAWLILLVLQFTWIVPIGIAESQKEQVKEPQMITEYEDVIRWRIDDVEEELHIEEVEIEVVQKAPEMTSLGEFQLTAYCSCQKCSSHWGKLTSTGTTATEGRTVAVDPTVIPYGTIIIINGHEYVAEDCGTAIKGKKIDIFIDDHERAKEFGVKHAEIFEKEMKQMNNTALSAAHMVAMVNEGKVIT